MKSRSRSFSSEVYLELHFWLVARLKPLPAVKGTSGLELFLEAYQLLLRKQCWALVYSKGLPSQLEPLVKDLWTLWLPLVHENLRSGLKAHPTGPKTIKQEVLDQQSSQEIQSTGLDGESENEKRQRLRGHKAPPTVSDALSLCYMAAMLLRIPLSVGEFHRCAHLALSSSLD